jgi:hypothetical protein
MLNLFAVCSLFSLDYSLFPERFKYLDKGYAAFVSISCLTLRHRSPTLNMMAEMHKDQALKTEQSERQRSEVGSRVDSGTSSYRTCSTTGSRISSRSRSWSGADNFELVNQVSDMAAAPAPVIALAVAPDAESSNIVADGSSSDAADGSNIENDVNGSTECTSDFRHISYTSWDANGTGSSLGYTEGGETNIVSTASTRSRARWHLAYTLLNNPSLIPLRGGTGGAGAGERVGYDEGELGF